jgi:hypothetical protein
VFPVPVSYQPFVPRKTTRMGVYFGDGADKRVGSGPSR